METKSRLTDRNNFQCQHNNRGYCKFGDKCRYKHFTKTCTKRVCRSKECAFRHPKPCKNRENCKFSKLNVCIYKHVEDDYSKQCSTV